MFYPCLSTLRFLWNHISFSLVKEVTNAHQFLYDYKIKKVSLKLQKIGLLCLGKRLKSGDLKLHILFINNLNFRIFSSRLTTVNNSPSILYSCLHIFEQENGTILSAFSLFNVALFNNQFFHHIKYQVYT